MATVVTLIHGTWAKRSDWTDPEKSLMADALRSFLPPPVEILRFAWSGRNSPRARRVAADNLRDHLRNAINNNPVNAHHFVIAHSHGGNVALQALNDPGLMQTIDGVACLSTPFLSVRDREVGPNGRHMVLLATVLWLVAGLVIVCGYFELRWYSLAGLNVLLLSLLAKLYCGWDVMVTNLKRSITIVPICPERIRILRFAGDEASAALLTSQFICDVTTRIVTRLSIWIAKAKERRGQRLRTLVMIAVCSLIGSGILMGAAALLQAPDYTPIIAGILLSLAGVVLALRLFPIGVFAYEILVSILVAPLVILLTLALLVPFGLTVALANLTLDVSADASPTGSWTVHLLDPPSTVDTADVEMPPRKHSAIYDSPAVFEDLCAWMKQRSH